jgi:serine/threonine-protein kinase
MPDPVASAADTELLARVEQVLAPTFELDHEIGRGGMGIVYLARDSRLKRPVAIKVLPPELAFRSDIRSRFLREAETSAQLSHPNIVPIFTVDERGGLVFFVMGYVEGETLAQRMEREGRVPAPDARRLLTEVASALAYAHSRGVIHRDIKPDNILLSSGGGRAMVTDFGIARAVSAGSGDSRLTATGVAIGTPAYMSPEQCAGDKEIDGRSDLYSLGVVAYQMLCGTLPFSGSGTGALLIKHLSEKPVPVSERAPDIPPWLARVVMRLLEKQPSDRFGDAGALVRALDQGETGSPPPAVGSTQPQSGAAAWSASPAAPPGTRMADPPPAVGWAPPLPAAPLAAAPAAGAAAVSEPERTRWGAGPVVKFRRSLVRLGIIGGICALIGLFTADSDWLTWTFVCGAWLAWKYGKIWRDGYNWRDVFKQPEDRLFFDVAAESIDSARALFDKDKRAEVRARLRRGQTAGLAELTVGVSAQRPGRQEPDQRAQGTGIASGSHGGLPVGPVAAALPVPLAAPPPLPVPAPVPAMPIPTTPPDDAVGLASSEVLNSRHGAIVRRAASDGIAVRQEVERLGAADRALLPDVVPTVDALIKRIASLAAALFRLDADLAPDALPELDKRIAGAEAESSATPDRERKLGLLRRQRATLQDLADRRATLSAQLENAGIVLRNIRLDLVRLRSAGVQSAIDDVATATQEARALSREIAHVLNAAEELKSI